MKIAISLCILFLIYRCATGESKMKQDDTTKVSTKEASCNKIDTAIDGKRISVFYEKEKINISFPDKSISINYPGTNGCIIPYRGLMVSKAGNAGSVQILFIIDDSLLLIPALDFARKRNLIVADIKNEVLICPSSNNFMLTTYLSMFGVTNKNQVITTNDIIFSNDSTEKVLAHLYSFAGGQPSEIANREILLKYTIFENDSSMEKELIKMANTNW